LGVILAKSILKLLAEYLNKEIPNDDYFFRRVPLKIFLQVQPEHRLEIHKGFFRNEKGDGMSVDWETICNDPTITQTRDGKEANEYGIVVLSYFDIKKELREGVLKVISDQINYDCHCLAKGIPMSSMSLREKKRELYDKLSEKEMAKMKSVLIRIRECLVDNAFWVIILKNPKLKSPPLEFNYSETFTNKIKEFFDTRGFPIPS